MSNADSSKNHGQPSFVSLDSKLAEFTTYYVYISFLGTHPFSLSSDFSPFTGPAPEGPRWETWYAQGFPRKNLYFSITPSSLVCRFNRETVSIRNNPVCTIPSYLIRSFQVIFSLFQSITFPVPAIQWKLGFYIQPRYFTRYFSIFPAFPHPSGEVKVIFRSRWYWYRITHHYNERALFSSLIIPASERAIKPIGKCMCNYEIGGIGL